MKHFKFCLVLLIFLATLYTGFTFAISLRAEEPDLTYLFYFTIMQGQLIFLIKD